MTFDSSADVGAWDDELGNPLLRGWGTTTDGSGDVPSDDEEDASSRSSDERGRLGDDHEWAANRAQILGREGAFLHMRDEGEREDVYDGDLDVVHGGAGSAPPITGTIALGGVEQPPLLGRDSSSLTLSECATCPEFWLLWCSIAASSGAAMALVNNMDAIAASAGLGDGAAAGMVSLFSVCNCVGRLCGGLASEWALHVRAVPRPAALCVAQAVVAIGAFALRVAPVRGGVFAVVSLVGFALGAHWGLAPSMSSEIFGAKHAGAVYGGLSVAPMIGSYALSTGVFGRMYDAAAAAQAAAAGRRFGSRWRSDPGKNGRIYRRGTRPSPGAATRRVASARASAPIVSRAPWECARRSRWRRRCRARSSARGRGTCTRITGGGSWRPRSERWCIACLVAEGMESRVAEGRRVLDAMAFSTLPSKMRPNE